MKQEEIDRWLRSHPIKDRIVTAVMMEFIKDHQSITKEDLEDGFKEFIEAYDKVKSLILLNVGNKPT